MADMTMDPGVGGSHPQQDGDLIKQWHSKNIEEGVEGTGTGTIAPHEGKKIGKEGEKIVLSQLQVDQEEKSDGLTETSKNLQTQVRKATGFGYATLSQYELDGLQTGDPILLGHKGSQAAYRGAPPPGPSGLGNAFFNPNPMVMFFKSYGSMLHMLKSITWASSKLIINGLKIDKEIGLAQANATLQAGKAEAKGQETQAWVSLATGCLGLISVGMGARAWMKARSAYSAEEKAQKATRDATVSKLDGQIERNNKDISKLERNIMAKESFHKKKFGTDKAETKFTIKEEEAALQKSTSKRAEKKLKAKEEAEQAEATKIEITQDSKKKKVEEKVEEEFANKDQAALEKSLANDRKVLKAKQFEKDQLTQKKGIAEAKLNAFKAGRLAHIGQSLQQDPMYMTWQALGGPNGSLNHYLQAFGHFAQAKATLESSYWKAWGEMCAMYLGITNKGLDMAIQMQSEANQQATDISQALQKMADQETNSMHWSG